MNNQQQKDLLDKLVNRVAPPNEIPVKPEQKPEEQKPGEFKPIPLGSQPAYTPPNKTNQETKK